MYDPSVQSSTMIILAGATLVLAARASIRPGGRAVGVREAIGAVPRLYPDRRNPMKTFTQVLRLRYPWAVLTTLVFLVSPGCGGDSGNSMAPEPPRVLTSVALHPTSSTISVREPLNTVALRVVAYDQDRKLMTDAGAVTFASVNELVARVREGSTVSAVAPGQTVVTARVTINGVTKTVDGTVNVVAEREPVLVGTWRGSATSINASTNVVFVFNGDFSMSAVGEASWACPVQGEWELSGNTLMASAHGPCSGSQMQITYSAPVSSTQRLEGNWVTNTGSPGTFSVTKD
jgi:hypothetical protein